MLGSSWQVVSTDVPSLQDLDVIGHTVGVDVPRGRVNFTPMLTPLS